MSVVVKVYRSDGNIKRELLYKIRVSRGDDLFITLINLLLKNFNIQVEVVDNNNSIIYNNNSDNSDNSNDDNTQDEYWFTNG